MGIVQSTARDQLFVDIGSLLASGEYSDLKITCGKDIYKVHTNIVCTRCGFFKRAISFGGKEANDGCIDLPDDEPMIIRLLIQYLYTGMYEMPNSDEAEMENTGIAVYPPHEKFGWDYTFKFPHNCIPEGPAILVCPHHRCHPVPSARTQGHSGYVHDYDCEYCPRTVFSGTEEILLADAKLYEIADKYNVSGLQDLVKMNFQDACKAFWDTPTFPLAAKHIFSSTPENDQGLRPIVVKTISQHPSLLKKAEIKVLMMEINGLAFGVLQHAWQKMGIEC